MKDRKIRNSNKSDATLYFDFVIFDQIVFLNFLSHLSFNPLIKRYFILACCSASRMHGFLLSKKRHSHFHSYSIPMIQTFRWILEFVLNRLQHREMLEKWCRASRMHGFLLSEKLHSNFYSYSIPMIQTF